MRLSTRTDYAVRMLILLGLVKDRLVTIEEVATRYDIPKNHLMKVALLLIQLGYVEGVRGRSGGLRLKKEPDAIRLGEVALAIEPDFALVDCMRSGGCCIIKPSCSLPLTLARAQEAFLAELNKLSLADLIAPKNALKANLSLEAVSPR